LIRSSSDEEFDKILEDHQSFLNQNGWEDIEAIRDEKMQENKEKLNLN
jgi:putative aldouronate transport system substrate-binding protein